MPIRITMHRRRVTTLTALVLVTGAIVATWLFAATHAVLPGIAGCGWVRDVDARIGCMSERIDASVRADGLEPTADTVDELLGSGAIGQECHVAWHPTGERLGRAAARDDAPLPSLQSTSFCTQGYDHGFLIAYLEESDASISSRQMSDVCLEIAGDGPINCVHAFGHAFARAADGAADDAFDDCVLPRGSALPDAAERTPEQLATECMSGVAMELAFADRRAGVDQVRARDCAGLDGDARTFCIGHATTRASMLGDDRPDDAVCAVAASDAAERRTCLTAALPRTPR